MMCLRSSSVMAGNCNSGQCWQSSRSRASHCSTPWSQFGNGNRPARISPASNRAAASAGGGSTRLADKRQSAKPHQLGGLHAFRGGIEVDVQIGFNVLGKKLAQPVRFNRRGQGKNGVYLLVARFNLADFRGDEERAVLHGAFPRQHAAPVVHEFATQCALVQPPGHPVAEPDENALLQRLVLDLARLCIETLVFGDAQKLLEQRPDLRAR